MTKLCLDVDELTEDFFDDTCLLGITTTIKNYQFCWSVNQSLNYRFRLNRDIEIHLRRRERSYYFRVYEHNVRHTQQSHYIYHNYNDGEYLLPEFRHMDFLWLIKGDSIETNGCRELMQAIKSLNGVQLVAELTNEKIRNKGHLIF